MNEKSKMTEASTKIKLPPHAEIRQAVQLYLDFAFGRHVPEQAGRFLPGDGCDVGAWLMGDVAERDPANAPIDAVRSFALRIGNSLYPNMKLRLSRPPRDKVFLFSVDSHDAFLHAEPGSPDCAPLEELKRHNAALTGRILSAWDMAGLPTERNYLRQKVQQARLKDDETIPPRPPTGEAKPTR